MSYYVVIPISMRIHDGLFGSPTLPSQNGLLKYLESYKQIYVLESVYDADEIARLFYVQPNHSTKTCGSYGLVIQVTVELAETPVLTAINDSVIYNNCVNSQKLNCPLKNNSEKNYQCVVVKPDQIKTVIYASPPLEAQLYNSALIDKFYDKPTKSTCKIL